MTSSDSEDEGGGCQLPKAVATMMIGCLENFLSTLENGKAELESKYQALERGNYGVYSCLLVLLFLYFRGLAERDVQRSHFED